MTDNPELTTLAVDVMKVMRQSACSACLDMKGRIATSHHTYATANPDYAIDLNHPMTHGAMVMWLVSQCQSVSVAAKALNTGEPMVVVHLPQQAGRDTGFAEHVFYARDRLYLPRTVGVALAHAVVRVSELKQAAKARPLTPEEQAKQAMADIENANDPADMAAAIRRLVNISVQQAVEEMKG